ncbi:SDR family NAD(P)-dependent oxidoreductase [soil metagenome]
MRRLDGKVLLVAGATGMAADAAERFAAEGAQVLVSARTEANCRQLVERIEAAGGGAAYHAADLREEAGAMAAVSAARERFGRLDGLYHVAGGSGRRFGDGPLHEATLESWNETFSLNLTTQFLVAREVIRTLLGQQPTDGNTRGSLLLMSSVLGFHPAPSSFPTHAYAAAKAAVGGLVRAAAAYYAPHGIRVNAIVPSLVSTPMSARAAQDSATLAYTARRQPLAPTFMQPGDVTGAAVYLLSDESRTVTGQLLRVDGGWSVSDAWEAGP